MSMKVPKAAILCGIFLLALVVYFFRLEATPFYDPPEGLHASIANEMLQKGDWITPHFNGVRYFDKPPLLYWLMAAGFWIEGPIEWTARFWSAIFACAIGVLTTWLGMKIGSPRLGLIAGIMVVANFGMFIFGRLVKPDMLFIFLILLAFTFFIHAYQTRSRWAVIACYGCLGATVIAKDFLGALGPFITFTLFFLLTRERDVAFWFPWKGVTLFLLIAFPWYLVMEWKNSGFLWYTVVDKHLLNMALQRVYPDEDVPLSAVEFLGVTFLFFLPWAFVAPLALFRFFRQHWESVENRVWLLLGLWSVTVIGFFTVIPFKLPHYGLPAFPFLALLVAKVWDDSLLRKPQALSYSMLLVPPLVGLVALTMVFGGFLPETLRISSDVLSAIDTSTRNSVVRGQNLSFIPSDQLKVLLNWVALAFFIGSSGLVVALWAKRPIFGLGILTSVVLVFLLVTVEGIPYFSESRSVRPIMDFLKEAGSSETLIFHEGPLENSGSLIFNMERPVKIVNGRQSNLAFGSTFPEAKDIFWSPDRVKEKWMEGGQVFLVSVKNPENSIVRDLPPTSVHLLLKAGDRWLYTNNQK